MVGATVLEVTTVEDTAYCKTFKGYFKTVSDFEALWCYSDFMLIHNKARCGRVGCAERTIANGVTNGIYYDIHCCGALSTPYFIKH
jgi:hypothetical protein